jgi:phage-related protein
MELSRALQNANSCTIEVALAYRRDAYRVVYAVQLDADIWILHAFQKKSKTGIKTPKEEIDLVRARLKRLKEALR